MTRVFLAAGVAALAISAPASAQRAHGGKDVQINQAQKSNGRAANRQVQRTTRPVRQQAVRTAPARAERVRPQVQPRQIARQQVRTERARPAQTRQAQTRQAQTRQTQRQQGRTSRVQQAQQTRVQQRQQARPNRAEQFQTRQAERQTLRTDRQAQVQTGRLDRQQLRTDRRLQAQNLRTERVQLRADNVARVKALAADRGRIAPVNCYGTRVLPMTTARSLIGVPLTAAATVATLNELPRDVRYLYPDSRDYYYRYGDGYLYRVDRTSNLIAALLPLLAGGYMPGSYLPNYYMSSYVPNYYGFNSFYRDYGNICYRYGYGVVYESDCFSGFVEDVIPLYAGGYGVGQMLPSAYSTYNVPYQYRSLYYDTPDYNYWYGPGAIYQYDRRSSLITSVAALLSPGFTVGQPLPIGYSTYNVPYAYRTTYYDTPNAWYRYNNGYIYQVNPTNLAVSAVVASILT